MYKNKTKQIEEQILDGKFNIGCSFVIFQKKSDAKAIAEYFDRGSFSRFFEALCGCLYDDRKTFKGRHITIKQAPEPSDIIWENLS